ncbi:MAG: hypothetical protein R2761_25400 [Acidimicrobiales bacterium]
MTSTADAPERPHPGPAADPLAVDAGGAGPASPLWLAHHWPDHYADRCVRIGRHHVCRRCLALYPLSFVVAFASAGGHPPWPGSWDPAIVWVLSLPATAAYVGEAVGWFRYRPWVQVVTTLIAALAFGRALGYELLDRWQPVFWGPIAVFGGIWFFATLIGQRRRPPSAAPDRHP